MNKKRAIKRGWSGVLTAIIRARVIRKQPANLDSVDLRPMNWDTTVCARRVKGWIGYLNVHVHIGIIIKTMLDVNKMLLYSTRNTIKMGLYSTHGCRETVNCKYIVVV